MMKEWEILEALRDIKVAPNLRIRDYFAAQAMQAIVRCSKGAMTQAETASEAYRIADAMLKERGLCTGDRG